MWRAQIDFFKDSFDVLAPDLPGFGDSAGLIGPDSIPGYADAVLQFLDSQNVGEFRLVGHSMGGMIVQQMALQAGARIRKLVLYGTGPVGALPDRFESIDESRRRLATDGVPATSARIAATWFVDGAAAAGYPICAEIGAKASPEAATASLSAWEKWNVKDLLGRIDAPTLVVWGDRDRSYGWRQPEALWRGIPTCSLAVVPGCAHNVHMEKPEIFNLLLADFLQGV